MVRSRNVARSRRFASLAIALLAWLVSAGAAAQAVLWQRNAFGTVGGTMATTVTATGTVFAIGSTAVATTWTSAFTLAGAPLFSVTDSAPQNGLLPPQDLPRDIATLGGAVFVLGAKADACHMPACSATPWLRRWEAGGLVWRVDWPPAWYLGRVVAAADALYVSGSDALPGALIARLRAHDGSTEWTRTAPIGAPFRLPLPIGPTAAGGVVVAGWDGTNAYLRRLSPAGDTEWTTTLAAAPTLPEIVAVDGADGTYVGGSRMQPGGSRVELWLARVAANGTLAWLRSFFPTPPAGVAADTRGWRALTVDGGGHVVGVATLGFAITGGFGVATATIAVDPDGSLRWSDVIAEGADAWMPGSAPLAVDPSGAVYVGTTRIGPHARIRKLSAQGTLVWTLHVPAHHTPLLAAGPGGELVALLAASPVAFASPQLMRIAPGPATAPPPPALALAPLPDPIRPHQPFTVVATLAGSSAPAGPIDFAVNGIPRCVAVAPVPLDATRSRAECTFAAGLAPGHATLTVQYGGDANHAGATWTRTLEVADPPAVEVPTLGSAALLLLAALLGIAGGRRSIA